MNMGACHEKEQKYKEINTAKIEKKYFKMCEENQKGTNIHNGTPVGHRKRQNTAIPWMELENITLSERSWS